MTNQDDRKSKVSPEILFRQMEEQGIPYTLHHHQPFFTVADGEEAEKTIRGGHCRNLFLRDKKGTMFLITALNETKIDLKKLPALLGCGRLSFGSPERLWENLGIRPGSVCPFAAINDKTRAVKVILDAAMMAYDIVNVHPLDNAMTTGLAPEDLVRYLRSVGHDPDVIDMKPAAPEEKESD